MYHILQILNFIFGQYSLSLVQEKKFFRYHFEGFGKFGKIIFRGKRIKKTMHMASREKYIFQMSFGAFQNTQGTAITFTLIYLCLQSIIFFGEFFLFSSQLFSWLDIIETREVEIFVLTSCRLPITFWSICMTNYPIHSLKYHWRIVDLWKFEFIINPNLVYICFIFEILPNLQVEPGISRQWFWWIPLPISISVECHAYMQRIAFDKNTDQVWTF